MQNAAEVKNLLGQIAQLEFRLNDETANAVQAAQTGDVPLGDKLYTNTATGGPVLLKREVIATGDQLTNATAARVSRDLKSISCSTARPATTCCARRGRTSASTWPWC